MHGPQIVAWHTDPAFRAFADADYRTSFALALSGKDHIAIMRELTFDGVAPHVTIRDIEALFDFIEQKILRRRMSGVGCELGAGAGVFSAILAKRPDVSRMYAVEACAPLVTDLMPSVVSAIAGSAADKVSGCIGDFNHLEIPDGSLDFMFDFFSLHHSADLTATLAGCRRVLKRGGVCIALDKARPDYRTADDCERMLDKRYDDAYKNRFGIPLSFPLSRRDNGEYEYRLQDWRAAFTAAGFATSEYFRLDKTESAFLLMRLLKKGLALLPPRLQPPFSQFMPHGNDFFDLAWGNRIFTPIINNFRKEMSLLVAYV